MKPSKLKVGKIYRFLEDTPSETIYKEGRFKNFDDYCDSEGWMSGSLCMDGRIFEVLDMEVTSQNDVDILIYIVKEDVTTNLNWSYLSQFVTNWASSTDIWNNLNGQEI